MTQRGLILNRQAQMTTSRSAPSRSEVQGWSPTSPRRRDSWKLTIRP